MLHNDMGQTADETWQKNVSGCFEGYKSKQVVAEEYDSR